MKSVNRYFLFCIISLCSITLKAGDFKGGILAGFCASQMDGDKLGGYNKFGPTLGFFVNRLIVSKWTAQFEMRYDQKVATGILNDLPYKARLNYIELPLMAVYQFSKKIKFEAGLEPSILYKSRFINGLLESNLSYHLIDIPAAIGGYYSFNEKINVSIRFSYSTFPIRGKLADQNTMTWGWNQFNNAVNFVFYYYLR
jgi:hypothetical protein